MKRVRKEEGGGGGDEGASPDEPNDFGKWLIRKIYVYAAVREADELTRVKKELLDRKKAYKKLLYHAINTDNMALECLCTTCGNVGDSLANRPICGVCDVWNVRCNALPWCEKPEMCHSGKHPICDICCVFVIEQECTGESEERCTYWNN